MKIGSLFFFFFLVHCIVQCKVKFVFVLAYYLLDVFGVLTMVNVVCLASNVW